MPVSSSVKRLPARRGVQLAFRKSFSRMALIERLADIIAVIVPDTVVPQRP